MSEPTPQPVAADQHRPAPPPRWRRLANRGVRRAVDAGLIGSRLQVHTVVCGYPRSGSTLLQLMIDACVSGVHSFTGEVEGRWAAEHAARRQPHLLTKRPADVEEVPALRNWYAHHPGRVQVVLTERDPRDILVSRHAGYSAERGFYCSPQRWARVHELVTSLRADADVTVVRYEDLVADPNAVQRQLAALIGWSDRRPFAEWHTAVPDARLDRMTRGALGDVRPVDQSSVGAWRRPENAGRLAQLDAELPQLPEVLAAEGWGR